MTELVRLLLDLLKSASPLRIVWQWERGLYYVAGKCLGEVGPGLKVVVPWLCDVKHVNIVPGIVTTPLQTVTLRNGRVLTFSASATIRVENPTKVYNGLEHWQETVVEMLAGELSYRLAMIPDDGFEPERRSALAEVCRRELDSALDPFGLAVEAIRFPNFVLDARVYRLLTERATFGSAPAPFLADSAN